MTAIDDTLIREGWPKFTNRRIDRGGPTKGGITLTTLAEYRQSLGDPRPVTIATLKALSEGEARQIYAERYINQPGFRGVVNVELREQLIDTGVLQGPGWAIRRLQEIVGVKVDGKIGPITLRATNNRDQEALRDNFTAARIKKLVRIVRHDARQRGIYEGQIEFLVGWVDRALEFLET